MRRVAWCIALLVAMSFAATEVVEFTDNWSMQPLYTVVSQSPGGVELVFSMHEMVVEEQVIDGVPMKSFGVPAVFLPDEGVPNLAGATRYVALPQGADVRVTVVSVRTEVLHGVEVAPAPNIPKGNDDRPLRYEKNAAIYGRDAYWPSSPVKVSKKLKMRGVDVVLVGVVPFQYNPVTKELIVYKDLRVRLDFVGGNGHFGEDRLRSRFWEPILANHLMNYASLPKIDFYAPERLRQDGYEYVIIVPDGEPVFEQWADSIKAWRKLQGISCEVYTLTEVGGSTTTAIENFLNNAYTTWTIPPAAFLLLSDYPSSGDAYGIPSPMWNSYCRSDNIYADVDGDDLPDMHHGRMTAQTPAHVVTMVTKFLSFERSPYTDVGFYDHPLVACGWQDDRWFQLAAEVVRGFLINELGMDPARQYNNTGSPIVGGPWSTRPGTTPVVAYWNAYGYVPLTNPYNAAWWSNGSAAGINAALNAGAWFVQHRDHGATNGWSEPSYTTSNLSGLTNTMFTFVNSTNCLTGQYDYSTEVFAERFHRIDYGCWGINAATQVSYSFVNDTYIWGMWDCMFSFFDPGYPVADMTGYDDLRPCMTMTSGKYYLHAMWFPDSVAGVGGYRVYTDHLFHHHGDCFTTLYSQVPMTLTVSHAASLLAGATSFTVSANDSAIIALTVNGEIIGVAEGTGSPVPITITPQTPGNTMKVTVTKANYYRYEADVPITSSSYPYVTLCKTIIDDTGGGNGDGVVNPGETIDYGVYGKNVGTGTAQQVYGLLSESDPYASVSVDSSWYGNIPQDDSALSNPYYTFAVGANCPDNHTVNFTLEFHDVNDSIFLSYPSVKVYRPILAYNDVEVTNDGNGNGILDPNETADLVVTLDNDGGATANNITSTLTTSSPYITINDASGNFPNIPAGGNANNTADPYNVTAAGSTPTGTLCDFDVVVNYDGIFADTFQFTIVVGKKHYYLWNPDPTPTQGEYMHTALQALGYSGDYGTTLAADLNLYQAVLVTLGIYPSYYNITAGSGQATQIENFLHNDGGRVYMEGNQWYINPVYFGGHDFGPTFGIDGLMYYTTALNTVAGMSGTFTTGMSFTHSYGSTQYKDYANATGTGYLIFDDAVNSRHIAFANDASTYRTVGSCFELGNLVDGTPPSTRSALLDSIMKFFGIVLNPGVGEGGMAGLPVRTMMSAMYPNPAARRLVISYQVAQATVVEVKVFDAAGRLVRTVASGVHEPGYYALQWDGADIKGRAVPAGVYFVRMQTSDYTRTEKAVLVK
jgi:hypothetical protein